ARSMITRLGMSERFTNVSLDRRGGGYLGAEQQYYQGREYSEDTQRYIDEEISRIMTERYQQVMELLTKHRGLLEAITTRLMDKEMIEREELMDLIKSDELGGGDYSARKGADLKPSDRAKTSGDARNEAIRERMAERRAAEEETARKAAEKKAAEEEASNPDSGTEK
ncbi:MAG: cell division protein FtsH, partial [Spirochaetaceae bacterium]|nr:cell division protein FtsH [Spirochaetaceae bacterium]